MNKKNEIVINVRTNFLHQYSDYNKPEFIFAYYITIINYKKRTIKLIERHWEISDANGNIRIVDGKVVVGKQPIIKMGHSFKYNSYCPINTAFGGMKGYYKMKDEKGIFFNVDIPPFNFVVPSFSN